MGDELHPFIFSTSERIFSVSTFSLLLSVPTVDSLTALEVYLTPSVSHTLPTLILFTYSSSIHSFT